MTIFINGKQKRVQRPSTIDGLDIDEFIWRNADPIWMHQEEMREAIPEDEAEAPPRAIEFAAAACHRVVSDLRMRSTPTGWAIHRKPVRRTPERPPMTNPFRIESVGDVTVATLTDRNCMQFEHIHETSAAFDRLLAESTQERLVIDLAGIPFYNSMSLGLLVSKNRKARDLGRRVRFCNLSQESLWAIEATGLDRILDIFSTRAAALDGF